MRLSQMDADKLRSIAASLLEITYWSPCKMKL
jgi:hypothetical protein